jgi:periplasmic protein TonB
MLISKFDLYNPEWLELVFENRNKEYGAYELRQHYARTMIRAMGITFFSVSLLLGGYFIFRSTPHMLRMIPVNNDPNIHIVIPVQPPKTVKPPAPPKPLKAEQPQQVATQQHIEMRVVEDQLAAVNPIKNDQLTDAIGPETTKGVKTDGNELPVTVGPAAQPGPDVSVHTTEGLDFMPEPVGGTNAWSKFLNKNLRFPAAAQEEGVSGKVWLSFIIEKDGSLSNIVVDRGAGHGFDEEALRVLKLAKAWKPGMQNGQPVRVKYQIPINFQATE